MAKISRDIGSLPAEMKQEILRYLDGDDLLAVSKINNEWRSHVHVFLQNNWKRWELNLSSRPTNVTLRYIDNLSEGALGNWRKVISNEKRAGYTSDIQTKDHPHFAELKEASLFVRYVLGMVMERTVSVPHFSSPIFHMEDLREAMLANPGDLQVLMNPFR